MSKQKSRTQGVYGIIRHALSFVCLPRAHKFYTDAMSDYSEFIHRDISIETTGAEIKQGGNSPHVHPKSWFGGAL